jgi:hypothetical protein
VFVHKDQILAFLPSLTKDELTAVIAVASQLLGGLPVAADEAASPIATIVLDAIAMALNRSKGPPLNALTNTFASQFNKKLPLLISFFNENFAGWDENKLLQIAFTREMMILLRDDLKRIDIKPTYLTLVRNLHRIGGVFESAFPGYIESGLGYIFLQRLRSSNTYVQRLKST